MIDRQNTGEINKTSLYEIISSNITQDLNEQTAFSDVQTTLLKVRSLSSL